jgi:membrane protein YqaA with SNARE-associated domain
MRTALAWLFQIFMTPVGLPLLAALDTSVVFFFPLGVDLVVILMSAREPSLAWLFALLATAGSMAGSGATYWLGRKVGQHGLERFVSPKRLRRIKTHIGTGAAISTGLLAVIPPPFPFTAFVLAGGAFGLDKSRLFSALAAAKLVRFGAFGALAVLYGEPIVRWMETDAFEWTVGGFILLAIAGTAISIWKAVRATQR